MNTRTFVYIQLLIDNIICLDILLRAKEFKLKIFLDSPLSSENYMDQDTVTSPVHIMACHLLCAKPLSAQYCLIVN